MANDEQHDDSAKNDDKQEGDGCFFAGYIWVSSSVAGFFLISWLNPSGPTWIFVVVMYIVVGIVAGIIGAVVRDLYHRIRAR